MTGGQLVLVYPEMNLFPSSCKYAWSSISWFSLCSHVCFLALIWEQHIFFILYHASCCFKEKLTFEIFLIPDHISLPQNSSHSHAELLNKVLQILSWELKYVSMNVTPLVTYSVQSNIALNGVPKSLFFSPPAHFSPSLHIPPPQGLGFVARQWPLSTLQLFLCWVLQIWLGATATTNPFGWIILHKPW